MTRRGFGLLVTGATVVAAAGVGLWGTAAATGAPAPAAAHPSAAASGWTTVFSSSFDGSANTRPSASKWKYDTGQGVWGTGEVENMTNSLSNVSLTGNSALAITPRRDGSGWTSGRIETVRGDLGAPSGGEMKVSARIELPDVHGAAAAGYWPAFWMLGTPQFSGETWPELGEVDTVESVNGVNAVHGTVHCGVDPGGPCNETTGITAQTAFPDWGHFATYTAIVDRASSPAKVQFFVNGRNYATVSEAQVGQPTWSHAFGHGFHVILDVAMGGSFPGSGTPTASTQGGHSMIVDGVTVQTKKG